MVLSLVLYLIYYGLSFLIAANWMQILVGLGLLLIFVVFIGRVERKEFSNLPLINKFYRASSPLTDIPTQATDNMKA